MLRRTTVLALVVGALVAVPAGAMAQWSHNTNPLTDNSMELTGSFKFSSGIAGSIECEMTGEAALEPGGTTGSTTKFAVDLDAEGATITSKCKAGGALSNCQVHAFEPAGLPWTLHTDTSKITITNGAINGVVTGQFCATENVTITASSFSAVPDNLHAMTKLTLEGTLQVDSALGNFNTAILGTQTILGADSGYYGIT